MRLLATLAVLSVTASSLAASSFAQTPTFTDPANLRGERVTPRDGRELPIDGGNGNAALGLQQLLRKLSTRASILNIVAHPDDEDGGMLTLYSRGLGARVADISLTRGEGGQNAATGDFEDALGLLRTQELLANDRYVGVDQMFGTEVDFGFSKTKSESFAKWTHERVLYDVVRAIRLYRPLVLTSTWIGNPTDGHGQHQVSGEIAQEAFLAAGDPNVFPELTAEGILPWQPLRVYARVPMSSISSKGLYDYATGQYVPAEFTNYVTGEKSTTPPTTDVSVHEGTRDPLLADDSGAPRSYIQFARLGLSQQKSQMGPYGRTAPDGDFDVAYHLYGDKTHTTPTYCHPERSPEGAVERPAIPSNTANCSNLSANDTTFFTGIDTSVMGIATYIPNAPSFITDPLRIIAEDIQKADDTFDPAHPAASAQLLSDAVKFCDLLLHAVDQISDLPATTKDNFLHELLIKRVQLNDALALSLGLNLTATVESADLPANVSTDAKVHLTESSNEHVVYRRVMSTNSEGTGTAEGTQDVQEGEEPHLASDHPVDTYCGFDPTLASNLTRPYFSRDNIEAPVYKLSIAALRDAPSTPPAITCHAIVTYKDTRIELAAVATYNKQPAALVPSASVALSNHAQVLPTHEQSFGVTLLSTPVVATPTLHVPPTWRINALPSATNCKDCPPYLIEVPQNNRQLATVHATASLDEKIFSEGYRPVGYGDLPRTNFYTPATDRIVPVDLNIPAQHHIAYLPGTGDDVPSALASIGLTPSMLTVDDLTSKDLKQYDTIILGVRTYAAHPDLHGDATKALLDYARNGGNVVVQYQTTEFTGDDAPYPLSLGSNEKVVDETAPVNLLTLQSSKDTQILTTPNRITPADFNGWIEERGHGFLSTWDAHYTALTETHDPGAPSEHVAPQLPQRGGLITTSLGKGRWTYCAFALYRQLPEAVPGAYRLFMNLINP